MAQRLRVMVSSSVRGNEHLLHRVHGVLNAAYEVWMSKEGTVPLTSKRTAFQNCLEAVQDCDVFVGIITGNYGSGREGRDAHSITHLEMLRAVELDKPRFVLVHQHVDLARQLLKPYRLRAPETGPFKKKGNGRYELIKWEGGAVISDLLVLKMYEDMMRMSVPLNVRTGNWVQPYENDDDAVRFIENQLISNAKRVKQQVREQFTSGPAPASV